MHGATRTDRARPAASQPEIRLPEWAPLYQQALSLIAKICTDDFQHEHGKGAQQRHKFALQALNNGNERGLRICLWKLQRLLQPMVDGALKRPLGNQRFRVLALDSCLRAIGSESLADATQQLQQAHAHWATFLRAKA